MDDKQALQRYLTAGTNLLGLVKHVATVESDSSAS